MSDLPYVIHDVEQRSEEWHMLRCGVFTASKLGPFLTAEKSMQLDKKQMSEHLTSLGIAHNPKAKNEELESLIPGAEAFYDYNETTKAARLSAICDKLGEIAGETKEVWPNDAMKRGTALEPLARIEYRRLYKLQSQEVGFVSYSGHSLGFSPDGLELDGDRIVGGQEIKAPQPSTHIRWLIDGGLPDEHKYQVHACLALSEAPWWDFFSFCPIVTKWRKERDRWEAIEWNQGNIPPIRIRVYPDEFTAKVKAGLLALDEEFSMRKRQMSDAWESHKGMIVAGKEAA